MVSAATLRNMLDYDQNTGVFVWRKMLSHQNRTGTQAGTRRNGYISISIGGRLYQAHRLAWLYVNGEFPATSLDHINCVKDDNRIANLRPATMSQNLANTKAPVNNTSGVKGVYWDRRTNRWRAQISVDQRRRTLGRFETIGEAAQAYAAAAAAAFGEYARAA